jgi:DNA-binding transcriptional LysR family regulator
MARGIGDDRVAVELRRLRYFVAVAEELHFRRAAIQLHVAQPALSQQVRKLESELGVELLLRNKRNVALTPAGVVFLDEARRVLRMADEAARAARAARSGTVGALRVGHVADALPTRFYRTVASFAASHPGVTLSAETLPARRAIEDVRAGRLDVAVVALPAPVAGLDVTSLDVEGTVAAVSDRHLLSGRPAIPLQRLADEPLLMLPRSANPAFHDIVLAAFVNAGIAPTIVEAAEPEVSHALLGAASGAGIAILPSSAAERFGAHGVTFRPLEPSPLVEIALVSRSDADDTTVAAFLRAAQDLDRRPVLRAVPAAS